ncbi:MAG: helix-turn-helix protein [Paenibacillus sp.]|nr:helix-turn-helix protein [Paenibacillus sp.]
MKNNRITTTSSSMYLTPESPVFVNRVSESFILGQHKHEFIEMNYVVEGSGYQYIEGKTIPVHRGDVFFLPLGVSHVFRPTTPMSGRDPLIVYNCLFSPAWAAGLSKEYLIGDGIRQLLMSSLPEQNWLHVRDREGVLYRAFNSMYEEFLRKEEHYIALIQAEIVRVLVIMSRMQNAHCSQHNDSEHGIEQVQARKRHTDEAIDACAEQIRKQMDCKLYLSVLSESAGLSERQFRRRFTERIGMSYISYVHKCRIEASCDLLLTTEHKIATIAQQVGYQDIKFFNRLFKKKTGVTPNQFRRNND